MDENEGLLPPEREYNMPTAQEEFNEPAPEQEHLFRAETPVEPVAVISAPAGRAGAVRRAVRYVAATAAAAVVLSQAPAPPAEIEPDWIDLPTDTKITCAAVRPDEPDRLYVSDVSLAHSEGAEELRLSYYLDYPDGTSIPCGRGTACGREAIVSELDGWVRGDSTYILYDDAEENPYDYDSDPSFWENNVHNGNLGIMLRRIPIDSYVEGMVFREVLTFRIDGDYYRMTSTRPVQLLPPDPEIRTELEALDLGDGMSEGHFRAVIHPAAGDDHDYFFGTSGQLIDEHWDVYGPLLEGDDAPLEEMAVRSLEGFCVRWYDADHRFLHSGWVIVDGNDDRWTLPTLSREGRDFVLRYDGPIHSGSTNPLAAYYSLEVVLADASTGWTYLIESPQLPITD